MQLLKTTPCPSDAIGRNENMDVYGCIWIFCTSSYLIRYHAFCPLVGRYCFSVASGGLEQTLKVAEKEARRVKRIMQAQCGVVKLVAGGVLYVMYLLFTVSELYKCIGMYKKYS